ncbi:hypothetical protein [Streptomyces sp. NPDC002690]
MWEGNHNTSTTDASLPSLGPGWADWYDTDMEFGEWFPRMLAGEIETDWMPEWPARPYAWELTE